MVAVSSTSPDSPSLSPPPQQARLPRLGGLKAFGVTERLD